jgi:signal transduction histidine kinase
LVLIILTAYGSLETAVEALRQGAYDYLFKPCEPDEIRKSVRAGLLKRQQELTKKAHLAFASDVSHQLRTPLASIDLFLQLLEQGQSEKRAHYLRILRRESHQMKDLIENTLTLSRLRASKAKTEFAPENLNAVAAQVVTARRVYAGAAGLELIFEPDAALLPVHAERNQLAQIVDNLVANAINYTLAGQVRVSTCLGTERGQACLQVQDTGIGMEPEDLSHLFGRFYRGQRARQLDIPGTGLGLAIVKEIVDLHRGKIEVESQVDEGSTFRVWLPLAVGN